MSSLVTLDNISLAFGLDVLLDQVSLQINKGERVCLIGRNGAGKSSLMKIIEGGLVADSGGVWRKPHLRLARLSQELPQNRDCSIYEFVAQGLSETGKLLTEYHQVTHGLSEGNDHDKLLARMEQLQQAIDACDGWRLSQNIETTLTRLQLDPDQTLGALSGGWQRRAALAQALVSDPELLLLDEPTNHLDIEAIAWLEQQLLASNSGLLFITHDRSLLQRLATRIIELDRGHLTSWPGDYDNFLKQKQALLEAEARANAKFDKKLAQEETWIRQGIKARRTRNEGRVRDLKALRKERAQRRERQGKASFSINQQEQSGKIVMQAKHVTHGFDNKVLIKDFSMRVMRGDRIGFIGANGMGKSTLLSILLGQLVPQQGDITLGTQLKIAYFDQLRSDIDLEKTAIDNLAQGSDEIEVNGKKKHVISYLRDFLFTPERARTPTKTLSGGERNRLLLARLFAQPANVLVLDEPTNDLDIETLELLEELLGDFKGTLLLVSHDRAFLNNIVTSTVVFEGDGRVTEYVGGYDDWLRQTKLNDQASSEAATKETQLSDQLCSETNAGKTQQVAVTDNSTPIKPAATLSYEDRKSLTKLMKKIETLETQQQALQKIMGEPGFYQQDASQVSNTLSKLKEVEQQLEQAYQSWSEIEG